MPLSTNLDSITGADIENLIEQREPEGQQLDYKAEFDSDKNEFRRDVSSFANSNGGDIVVGVAEEKGIPSVLRGINLSKKTAEQYKNQIIEILRARIKPMIPGVRVHITPPIDDKRFAVIRVPKSMAAPHQVEIENKQFEFWVRREASKQRMDIDELRGSILASETLTERIRNFRLDRLSKITVGEEPVVLKPGARLVLHMIPSTAFDPSVRHDISWLNWTSSNRDQNTSNLAQRLTYLFHDSIPSALYFNLEGLIAVDRLQGQECRSYVQIFRNGIVEVVDAYRVNTIINDLPIWHPVMHGYLIKSISRTLELQEKIGVGLPVYILVSLIGMTQHRIFCDPSYFTEYSNPLGRENILLPVGVVDGFSSDTDEGDQRSGYRKQAEITGKDISDTIWNAGGFDRCYHFDENGVYHDDPTKITRTR